MTIKRGVWAVCLTAEALLCVIINVMRVSVAGAFSAIIAFPFEQIGYGLRALSLSGSAGNIAAIALYVVLSLLPLVVLAVFRRRRKLYAEDSLLLLLSATLFAVLYLMINPGYIPLPAAVGGAWDIGKAVLGTTTYSVILGYIVLRVIRLFSAGDNKKLFKYMGVCLLLLNALFVYLAFGDCFGNMLVSIASLRESNTGNEQLLGPGYVFAGLQFCVNALPYVLDVFVAFAALRLLSEMRSDRYCAESVAAAEKMSRVCAKVLTITVLANIAFNLLQLLFAKWLPVINSTVQIPVLPVIFVLAALLLTRFVTESKQLKEENDMFI